jgi:hypothetical protein
MKDKRTQPSAGVDAEEVPVKTIGGHEPGFEAATSRGSSDMCVGRTASTSRRGFHVFLKEAIGPEFGVGAGLSIRWADLIGMIETVTSF